MVAANEEILNAPLWRLEFADGSMCVAEAEGQFYLVLFTGAEQAREFLEGGTVSGASPVRAVVFSEDVAQFQQAARHATEEGLHGAIIDPHPNGKVDTMVHFAVTSDRIGHA